MHRVATLILLAVTVTTPAAAEPARDAPHNQQGLMELDVRATAHLSVFAGLRMELRDLRFPESSSGYPTAGVRFWF